MLTRIAKYSVKNILRNKFLSFSSVLVLTLLMFFINILVILHDVSFKLIASINSKLTISLYLDEQYNKNSVEVIDMINDIKKINGSSDNTGIGVQYKTKDDILDDMRAKEPGLVKILERSNPLPDTIVISNVKLDQYTELNRVIENKMFVLSKEKADREYFANYTSQYEKIVNIIRILDILQIGLYVIIAIFMVSISIIIYSVIGNFIYYYRDEIYITRLVGGSRDFIYGPFMMQGSIYSFVAYVLSLFIFILILNNVNLVFEDIYTFNFPAFIFIIEMVLFVFIGGVAGYLSSKKYLK
ncbi:MAG: FtsX-like permease family protein [Candidatus Gracilibacteria bacterium]|nr:FtsX-like permease family protein [Candidatus Gracilibacteria bacterium]